MAGEPSWFELGVGDVARGRAFYGGLFGWEAEEVPGGGLVLRTAGAPGGMHGGDAGAVAMAFFAVDDLDAALVRVAELGGAHIPMGDLDGDAAPLGRFAICRDDQGSLFGLHERPPG
jgi:predicted enzyme related to lactoylglutathione lyase